MKRFPVARILTAVIIAVLSALLLELFAFYPLQLVVVVAIGMGAVALEFPSLALWVAVILSMFAGFYQNPFIGVTYFVVFLLLMVALTNRWIEVALVSASWMLAFSPLAALAIVPTVLAGLHLGKENALKIGAVSAISIFLLGWSIGLTKLGLLFVPFPRTDFVVRPLQDPWQFTAFLPNLTIFTPEAFSSYYSPLLSNLLDLRVDVLIVAWLITGYLVTLLAGKFGKSVYGAPIIAGVVPVIAVSAVFAEGSVLDLGIALAASAVAVLGYGFVKPAVAVPTLGTFSGFNDLVPRGIPGHYSVLLGSPACDEKNLIVEQFMRSGLKQQAPCFVVTADVSYGRSLASKDEGLTVLICNQRAGEATEKNAVRIPSGIQNLTTLNIELVNAVKDRCKAGSIVCLDTISDALLSHKLLTTRKWVADILPRLEGWGYTVLGVFNPTLHAKEDCQGLVEQFKGYVEISEKDQAGKMIRTIAVRKMADQQYRSDELVLDRERLTGARAKKGLSIRERLAR